MAFEKFTETRTRMSDPTISISSRGRISFNTSAVNEYSLTSFQYALLFFDTDTNRIGLVFTNERENGASKVSLRTGLINFSAINFLKTYKVDISVSSQHMAVYDKENKMFILQPKMKADEPSEPVLFDEPK